MGLERTIVVCANCQAKLNITGILPGTDVKCGKCANVFPVPEPEPGPSEAIEAAVEIVDEPAADPQAQAADQATPRRLVRPGISTRHEMTRPQLKPRTSASSRLEPTEEIIEYAKTIDGYKKKTSILSAVFAITIVLGLVFLVALAVAANPKDGPSKGLVTAVFIYMLATSVPFIGACIYYMKGKGLGWGYGLLGILGLIGLVIMALLPDEAARTLSRYDFHHERPDEEDRAYAKKLRKIKRNAVIAILAAVVLFIVGFVLIGYGSSSKKETMAITGAVTCGAAFLSWIAAMAFYSMHRGYHAAWGILAGFICLLGFLVIGLLPDKAEARLAAKGLTKAS